MSIRSVNKINYCPQLFGSGSDKSYSLIAIFHFFFWNGKQNFCLYLVRKLQIKNKGNPFDWDQLSKCVQIIN